MTTAEAFSWLTFVSVIGLAWLAAGVSGALCLIAGAIVSQIDVGWIDAYETAAKAEPAFGTNARNPDRVVVPFKKRL